MAWLASLIVTANHPFGECYGGRAGRNPHPRRPVPGGSRSVRNPPVPGHGACRNWPVFVSLGDVTTPSFWTVSSMTSPLRGWPLIPFRPAAKSSPSTIPSRRIPTGHIASIVIPESSGGPGADPCGCCGSPTSPTKWGRGTLTEPLGKERLLRIDVMFSFRARRSACNRTRLG